MQKQEQIAVVNCLSDNPQASRAARNTAQNFANHLVQKQASPEGVVVFKYLFVSRP